MVVNRSPEVFAFLDAMHAIHLTILAILTVGLSLYYICRAMLRR